MTDIRELLASNMKKHRAKLGLSQEKLAEKAKISANFISMIEIKRKFPKPEVLEKIATALEIDTPELFSIPLTTEGSIVQLHETILKDIKCAVKQAVDKTIWTHISALNK